MEVLVWLARLLFLGADVGNQMGIKKLAKYSKIFVILLPGKAPAS